MGCLGVSMTLERQGRQAQHFPGPREDGSSQVYARTGPRGGKASSPPTGYRPACCVRLSGHQPGQRLGVLEGSSACRQVVAGADVFSVLCPEHFPQGRSVEAFGRHLDMTHVLRWDTVSVKWDVVSVHHRRVSDLPDGQLAFCCLVEHTRACDPTYADR